MKLLMTTVLAVVLGGLSATCFADAGNFFVSADAGQASYHVSSPPNVAPSTFNELISPGELYPIGDQLNKNRGAGAFRFGYQWHGLVDYGVEVGYAYLGKVNSTVETPAFFPATFTRQSYLSSQGALLGGNLKYNLNNDWYASLRGGWYRAQIVGGQSSQFNQKPCPPGFVCPIDLYPIPSYLHYGYSQTVTGEYFGAGAGFNFSSNFSLGVSYDYYRSGRLSNGFSANAGLLSLSAEYRF
jgi:OmpA-OmpF porin, OOP family